MVRLPVGTVTPGQTTRPIADIRGYAQDAAISSRIERVLPEIGNRVAESLSPKPLAVLLTGSFARGEGSARWVGNRLRALGDMEFLVLCPTESDLGTVQQVLDHQACRLRQWLASHEIECELEFSAVDRNYLSHLRPHIFAFELLAHAQTVWGDDQILASAPRFPAYAIPRWDAWRLLNNRLLEQLQWAEVSRRYDVEWLQSAFYHVLKCYLDLATTVLIFEGQYRSRYTQRAAALKAWANVASQRGVGFAALLAGRVAACTEFKLHPHPEKLPLGVNLNQGPRQLSVEVRRAMVDLVALAHQVWRSTAMAFAPPSYQKLIEDSSLSSAVLRAQPLRDKLRGWAKIALMSEVRRQPGFLRRMNKLLFEASPRYLIYSVASELYFQLPQVVNGETPAISKQEGRLPVSFARHADERRAWWRLRADALLGWKLFLRNHWA